MSVRATRGNVRAFDAWKRARGGTEVRRGAKKRTAGDGSTRADKKAGKNYFGGSEGAGEKKIIWAGAKKSSGVDENTQPTKRLTYSRDVLFLPIPLRSIYWKELQPLVFF